SEEHTSELQSRLHLVCRLLLEKKNASPPTTHRVKRIKAGQTTAKIAIGKPDGPSFNAKGSIVTDPEANKVLFETFAKKYTNEWKPLEQKFRDGLANGSRVLIKYEPAD